MDIRQIPPVFRRLTHVAVVGAAVVGSIALATTAQGQDPQQQGSSDGREWIRVR